MIFAPPTHFLLDAEKPDRLIDVKVTHGRRRIPLGSKREETAAP
jgi:hypothetical protein